ncbi:MAG: AgmX/PglI C-terminal domain-containing protein [Myxococcales bacterium]|jgi:hypothetical protein|nr:AgmX/PglI C-terminal domain-containing protein [Myxococcales bacterium]
MRAFFLGLAITLLPGLALAQTTSTKKSPMSAEPRGMSATGMGSASSSGGRASPRATTAAKPDIATEDELAPLDVSNMLFDAHSIRQVVQHHMPQIQACYEKVLSTSGQRIEGRVVVGFIIDVTGTVVEARLLPKKSSLSDERVIDCVLLRVRRLVFPKPPDNRRYPIEFPFELSVKK